MKLLDLVKRLPIDLGQGWYRHTTKAKLLAYSFVETGEGRSALDLGCGDGYWTRKLQAKGWTVTSTNYRDARFSGALDVNAEESLPFRDAQFDLVWALEVIEHVRNVSGFVREVRRVLRPGGHLILTTPNSAFWLYSVLSVLGITPAQIQNPDHKQFFSHADIRALFPQADIYGFFPYAVVKFAIRRGVSRLSPTFVAIESRALQG